MRLAEVRLARLDALRGHARYSSMKSPRLSIQWAPDKALMAPRTIETDYLVVGSGAAGMAFVDSLTSASKSDVVIVDRRHAPGGHWNDAYPFVRLHQPSSYYGVNSLVLGTESLDRHGPNEGMYERASAPEICAYFDRVMQQHLLPSG